MKLKFASALTLLLSACMSLHACRNSSSDGSGPNCEAIGAGEAVTRIAIVGDTGDGSANQFAVADLIASGDAEADFAALVLLGDMIYEEGDATLITERILTPYTETLDGDTALFPVIGNHDIRLGMEEQIMTDLGATGRWYSRRVGPVGFIVLDSTRPEDSAQLAWLEAELAAADAPWIVAAMHHPMYSAGVHGSSRTVRANFQGLFEQYGVDLVLAGHDHDYQRQKVIRGITYIVSGGGAKLRDAGRASFSVVSESVLHYVELEFSDTVLEATAHGVDGTVDTFSICDATRDLL